MLKRGLWLFVILSLLLALPLVYDRLVAENSTKRIEVVGDYERLKRLQERSLNQVSMPEMLERLKDGGYQSIAVHETTMRQLADEGILHLYTSNHLNIFSENQSAFPPNQVVVLFSPHLSDEQVFSYKEMIQTTLPQLTTEIVWQNDTALLIELPMQTLLNVSIGIDFNVVRSIQRAGLNVVARLNSNQPYEPQWIEEQFRQMHAHGIHSLIFQGSQVLGFGSGESIAHVAQLITQYDMTFAVIEFHEQQGYQQLSKLTGLQSVRLLSVSDQMFSSQGTGSLADMLTLGVKERNIRLVYINHPGTVQLMGNQSVESILQIGNSIALQTYNNVSGSGFVLGQAVPFSQPKVLGAGWQRALLVLATFALASLLLAMFWEKLIYLPLPIGILGFGLAQFAGLEATFYQGTALLAAITAPSLATIIAIRWLKNRETSRPVLLASMTLIGATILSLFGAYIVVGLLNLLTYVSYVEQFRGVKLLHTLPAIIVALYVLLQAGWRNVLAQAIAVYQSSIKVKHILLAVVIVGLAIYYMTRSTNEGIVLPFELQFRQWLNDVLGVRPRTKELLIFHPLFVLAGYLVVKYKKALYLFIPAVIGQLSVVSTFTHLHTPLFISIERTVYGVLGGLVIGLILILLFKALKHGFIYLRQKQTTFSK